MLFQHTVALKSSKFIAFIAASNFSFLNKSPPSVLPAFIHILFVTFALSSINVLRDGSPPTHFSASETVTTNRLGMQFRAQCWLKHIHLNCAVKISDSYTVLLSYRRATPSKPLAMQLPFYAATSQKNQIDRCRQNTTPDMCIIMFTINSLHQVHHTNTH